LGGGSINHETVLEMEDRFLMLTTFLLTFEDNPSSLELIRPHLELIRPNSKIIRPHFKKIRPHLELIRSHFKIIRPHFELIRSQAKIIDHTLIIPRHFRNVDHIITQQKTGTQSVPAAIIAFLNFRALQQSPAFHSG
jgi:hypothetical protein